VVLDPVVSDQRRVENHGLSLVIVFSRDEPARPRFRVAVFEPMIFRRVVGWVLLGLIVAASCMSRCKGSSKLRQTPLRQSFFVSAQWLGEPEPNRSRQVKKCALSPNFCPSYFEEEP